MGKAIKLRLNWLSKLRINEEPSPSLPLSASSFSSSSPQVATYRYNCKSKPPAPSSQLCCNSHTSYPPTTPNEPVAAATEEEEDEADDDDEEEDDDNDCTHEFHYSVSYPPHFCNYHSNPPPPGLQPNPPHALLVLPSPARPTNHKVPHRYVDINASQHPTNHKPPRHAHVPLPSSRQQSTNGMPPRGKHVMIASLVDCGCSSSSSSRFTRLSKASSLNHKNINKDKGKDEDSDEVKKRHGNEVPLNVASSTEENQSTPLLMAWSRTRKGMINEKKIAKSKKKVMHDKALFCTHDAKQDFNDLTKCSPSCHCNATTNCTDPRLMQIMSNVGQHCSCIKGNLNRMDASSHSDYALPWQLDHSMTSEDNLFSSSFEKRDVAVAGRRSFSSSSSSDLYFDHVMNPSINADYNCSNHLGIRSSHPWPSPLSLHASTQYSPSDCTTLNPEANFMNISYGPNPPGGHPPIAPSKHHINYAQFLPSVHNTNGKHAIHVPSQYQHNASVNNSAYNEMKVYHNNNAARRDRGIRRDTSSCDASLSHNLRSRWTLRSSDDHQQAHNRSPRDNDDNGASSGPDDHHDDGSSWGSSFSKNISMDGETRASQCEFSEDGSAKECHHYSEIITRGHSRSCNVRTGPRGEYSCNGWSSGSAPNFKPVRESVAMVKSSSDPLVDFRDSMVDMILENQIYSTKGLEDLLHGFLALNSKEHHGTILKAFTQVWDKVFSN